MNPAVVHDRQELAYWLTLAFHLEGEKNRDRNGLVLTASRELGLGLLDLVDLDTAELPTALQPFAGTHARLLAAEGRASAQAFVVERLHHAYARLLPITHPSYPRQLLESLGPARAPTLLSAQGNLRLLEGAGVCVSGSRRAARAGLAFARAAGRALAEAGIVLISGLARGVDSEAMEGALEAGGSVVGVSAEGLLNTRAAARPEVREGRLLILSEFAPTARWAGWAAMRRNHTLAGSSRALIIADCVAEGGTTAQFSVHRDLRMPVFVRRGRGEGALMSELATRPGASPLAWESGPVQLPRALVDGPSSAPDQVDSAQPARLSVRHDDARVILHLDAPASMTNAELLRAIQRELQRARLPSGALAAHEGHVTSQERAGPRRPSTPPEPTPSDAPASVDPVLEALAMLPKKRGTISALAEQIGWSQKKLRGRLKALAETGRIHVDTSGRAHVYALQGPETAREPELPPSVQLGLIPRREPQP
ncbi:DNA-processing protein DprA [Pseudenhygromyxa sp. WMMC2535]|uniref:DNA-processing protein DprA n=1 Tax=Pseudenhygromyxa sp. WMMC2535 TaxID=2712867 RepID=UPI00155724B6|nr:DNA-processing protein DprA [Pseudenhygromyxa sp. WMMC2535]NVB37506.1 DNA-processing protein DprA [Pseudenhygromyxa sp. WMMC2535]